MNETLDELLKHFIGKTCIDYVYAQNITDNIEDRYDLDEIINYGHYIVVEWEFDLYDKKLLVVIEKR